MLPCYIFLASNSFEKKIEIKIPCSISMAFKLEMLFILLKCSVWFLLGVVFLHLKEAFQSVALGNRVSRRLCAFFQLCIHSLGIELCGRFVPIIDLFVCFCLLVLVCML